MSELEDLKTENANLKAQAGANQQGIHALMAQLEAHKGALGDANIISMQLRTNIAMLAKSNQELAEKVQKLEAELAAIKEANKDAKSAEVPPLKEVSKGK